MSSWRSTERYEDCIFWKRSVSLSFLGVFFCCVCLGCVCVWGLFRFGIGRHLAFCFSPVLEQRENSWLTTRRFEDRPSLERARHELKKILQLHRLFLLREITKTLLASFCQKANSCLRNNDCVSCHASTRRDSSEDKTESIELVTQQLALNKLTMSLRLCSIAKLDLASGRNLLVADSHSTTVPMSPTACIFDWGTSIAGQAAFHHYPTGQGTRKRFQKDTLSTFAPSQPTHRVGCTVFGSSCLERLSLSEFSAIPGACRWLVDHTSKQIGGVLAIEAASSMLSYC